MAMQEDDHHKVFITKAIPVHPRSNPLDYAHAQSQAKLIKLSNLDRKCPILMCLVFFYKSPPIPTHNGLSTVHDQSFFTSLKVGLEETLSAWYPAAGRLFLNPESGKLDLVCCSSGAVLAEATTQIHISELGDLSQYNSFFENLVCRPPISDNLSEMPLLVAQLTKFGCGGYALGVGTNHSLFDGLANFNFLQAWGARTARGEDAVVGLEPVHERGRLLVGHGQTLTHSHTQQKSRVAETSVVAFDHLHQLIKQAAGSMECNSTEMSGRTTPEQYVLKSFSLGSAMVRKLKSQAGSDVSGGSLSSFEVVAAHLWKARTKTLGIPKERKICLQFTVDTRNRMVPQMPKNFTGNAYVLSSISCTSGELEEESLSAVVQKIKAAKSRVTENYVLTYLEALEEPQGTLPSLPELIIVSDWTRTPYHEVNFGMGVADYVVPLSPPIQQVAYFMQSPGEAGGIDLRIGLQQEHVLAFSHHFLDVL